MEFLLPTSGIPLYEVPVPSNSRQKSHIKRILTELVHSLLPPCIRWSNAGGTYLLERKLFDSVALIPMQLFEKDTVAKIIASRRLVFIWRSSISITWIS
jgi:hypothetical protein